MSQPLGCQQGNCRNAGGVDDDVWCHPPNISCRCTGAPGGVVGSSGRGGEFEAGHTRYGGEYIQDMVRECSVSPCLLEWGVAWMMDAGWLRARSSCNGQGARVAGRCRAGNGCLSDGQVDLVDVTRQCLFVFVSMDRGCAWFSASWVRCLCLARLGHYGAAQCKYTPVIRPPSLCVR